MLTEIYQHLITTCIGLGILASGYLCHLLTGVARVAFTPELKWSWKKMLEGLVKAGLWGVAILLWVVVCDGVNWFAKRMGADIEAILDGASVAGLVGGLIGGTVYYVGKSFKNIIDFVNTNHTEVKVNNPDYKGVADAVENVFDTMLGRSVKEALEEEDLPELEGEDVEPGKGAYYPANTYPEPYRSAAQDSMTDPSTCYNRECVSYCAWKIKEIRGSWPARTGSMSAKYWVDRLPSWGYKKVSSPKDGGKYVGVSTAGTYGHVVWFEGGNMVSEYNYSTRGGFGVRNVNLGQYIWYEIKAPTPAPKPTPAPTPAPTPKPTPAPSSDIKAGDSVIAWGQGTATSLGTGAKTKNFKQTKMKVIMVVNGRYALNQYNKGSVGNAAAVTGWWPKSQISK